MTRAGSAALASAALVLSAGCASPAGPAEPQLEVAAEYGRHAAVQGKVDLYVANRGSEPVEVASYQVAHPMFERLPAVPRTSLLPPDGRQRIVPIAFGEPLCDVTTAAGAEVVLAVRDGERVRDVRVPLGDREPGLLRAHRLACAAQAVASVADFALRTDGLRAQTSEGTVLRMSLQLSRRGPRRVEVTELSGNILFTVTAPAVVLPADQDEVTVELLVRASRCDRHALTESKTSFTFPLFARIDGGEPARLTVTATGPARAALQALLDDTCEVE